MVQTHFSGARCSLVTSKGVQKNKKIISFAFRNVRRPRYRQLSPSRAARRGSNSDVTIAARLERPNKTTPAPSPIVANRVDRDDPADGRVGGGAINAIRRSQYIGSRPTKNPPEAEIRAGSLRSKHGALFKGTARGCYHGFCSALSRRFRRRISDPITSDPEKKDKSSDQAGCDRHPELSFETKKRETLDQKLHRFRPHFLCKLGILLVQHRNFCGQNILFLYFISR